MLVECVLLDLNKTDHVTVERHIPTQRPSRMLNARGQMLHIELGGAPGAPLVVHENASPRSNKKLESVSTERKVQDSSVTHRERFVTNTLLGRSKILENNNSLCYVIMVSV